MRVVDPLTDKQLRMHVNSQELRFWSKLKMNCNVNTSLRRFRTEVFLPPPPLQSANQSGYFNLESMGRRRCRLASEWLLARPSVLPTDRLDRKKVLPRSVARRRLLLLPRSPPPPLHLANPFGDLEVVAHEPCSASRPRTCASPSRGDH